MNNVKLFVTAVVAALVIVALVAINPFVKGDPTQVIVAQPMFGGEMTCIEGGGWHWKGLASVYRYNLVDDFYFNSSKEKVNGRGWEGDDSDEDDIPVTFSKKAKGDVVGHIQYYLPTDCDKLILIHKKQKSVENLKHNFMRNKIKVAVTNAAILFNAADAIETRKIEYQEIVQAYLNTGMYKTYTEDTFEKLGEDVIDSAGKVVKKADVQKYTITKLVKDSLGNPIVSTPSELLQYGITVNTPEIIQIKLDQLTTDQIKAIRDKEMKNITNATAAETAKQSAITAEAEGRARIAQAKADYEVEKQKAVTQAEKEKAVAVLAAQQEYEVAALEAKKANEVAKKIEAEGKAEAAANRAKVQAGLTPQERAEWDYKTKVGVAEALAKSSHPLVPEIMMSGDGKNGSAMDAVGLNMLMNITERLSK